MSQSKPKPLRCWLLAAATVAILFVAAVAGVAGVRAIPGAVAAVGLVAIVCALCVLTFLVVLSLLPTLILLVGSMVGFRAYCIAAVGFGWVRKDGRWKRYKLPKSDFIAFASPGDQLRQRWALLVMLWLPLLLLLALGAAAWFALASEITASNVPDPLTRLIILTVALTSTGVGLCSFAPNGEGRSASLGNVALRALRSSAEADLYQHHLKCDEAFRAGRRASEWPEPSLYVMATNADDPYAKLAWEHMRLLAMIDRQNFDQAHETAVRLCSDLPDKLVLALHEELALTMAYLEGFLGQAEEATHWFERGKSSEEDIRTPQWRAECAVASASGDAKRFARARADHQRCVEELVKRDGPSDQLQAELEWVARLPIPEA